MWKILPFFVALFVVGLGSSRHGGIQDMDPNNPHFRQAVDFAVSVYNSNSPDEHIYKVKRVLKAQSQVVAGVNYIMTVKLGKTSCIKNGNKRFCHIIKHSHDDKFIICHFTVWHRSWFDSMRLMRSKCKKDRTKRDGHLLHNYLLSV